MPFIAFNIYMNIIIVLGAMLFRIYADLLNETAGAVVSCDCHDVTSYIIQ